MYKERQNRLCEYIKDQSAVCALITFEKDIWWLTGFRASFGFCVVFEDGRVVLVSDSRYEIAGKKAAKDSGADFLLFDRKALVEKFEDITGTILGQATMMMREKMLFESIFVKALWKMESGYMQAIRRKKTAQELENICLAQAHVDSVLPDFLRANALEGATEKEVAFGLEIALRGQGRYGLSFDPIVAFGANSALPHHSPTDKKLEKNMPILIDCGVTYDGYCSDMTRNAYFGIPSEAYQKDYDVLRAAQEETVKQCWAGSSIEVLSAYCRKEMGALSAFFGHSLGHGVGVEIHEMPWISMKSHDVLKVGDVITIEPGVYKPGEYGIRIEDLLVIQEQSPEVLSTMSKDLFMIQA